MKNSYLIIPFILLTLNAKENTNIFNLNNNLNVLVNSKTLSIRKKPLLKSEIIGIKQRGEKLIIKGCNKHSWCELKQGGYVPMFLLKNDKLNNSFKENFTENKNSYFQVKEERIKIYTRPYYRAKTISSLFKGDIFKVQGCDEYSWCKISNNKFVKKVKLEKSLSTIPSNRNQKDFDEKLSYELLLSDLKKQLDTKPSKIKKNNKFKKNYIQALTYLKNKKYDKAYILLKELFSKKPNDININFYLGITAFELQKFTEALNAYERVLFEKPKALRALYEKAKTLFFLSDLTNSKKLFEKLKKEKLENKTLRQIDKYLLVIENKRKKHHFSGAFILGLNYDSNINNAPSEAIFKNVYIPQLDITQDLNNTTEKNSDKSLDIILALNHLYKAKENTHFKNNFLFFSKNMSEFRKKDTFYFLYSPSLVHQFNKKSSASFSFLLDKLLLDNKSYIYNYGIKPSFNIKKGQNLFSMAFKYQQKKYIQEENKNKNSKLLQINLADKILINKTNISEIALTYSNERKDNSSLTINYDEYKLRVAHTLSVFKNKIYINPALSYRYIKFIDFNENYKKDELSKKIKFELNNNYIFNKKTIYKLGLNYENSSSNIPNSKYDKYGILLNLIRTF